MRVSAIFASLFILFTFVHAQDTTDQRPPPPDRKEEPPMDSSSSSMNETAQWNSTHMNGTHWNETAGHMNDTQHWNDTHWNDTHWNESSNWNQTWGGNLTWCSDGSYRENCSDVTNDTSSQNWTESWDLGYSYTPEDSNATFTVNTTANLTLDGGNLTIGFN